MSVVASALTRVANNGPLLARVGAAVARIKPIVRVGHHVIVLRHADVREVLARDEDFTIAEVNAARMDRVNGPFVLGMDRSPIALRERGIIDRAVRDGDPERIRAFVRTTARELVQAKSGGGRLDVVQDLARPAAIRLVAHYFGVPGPDEATMKRWMRTIFHETFLNLGDDRTVRAAAESSAGELHRYADDLIARRRSPGAEGGDDYLSRLVATTDDGGTPLGEEGVRRNIGGIIVGAVETTSKATAHAVDQLLRRPDALRNARAAAIDDDMDTVRGYALDALRFNPLNPVLVRRAARASVVAAGTSRAREVPAGRTVYAAILPAMFDPAVFDHAQELRPDRPLETYLHFGDGLHRCFGRYVNLVQIPELVAAVLRLDGLRRAPGPDGAIRYAGPFPDRLLVDFEPVP